MKNDRNIKSSGKKTIILRGPLTIQKIGELKDTFSESYSKNTDIVVDHSAGEGFDFSYLQLLYSMYNTLKERNLNLSIGLKSPVSFNKLYKESGFDSTVFASSIQLPKEALEERI